MSARPVVQVTRDIRIEVSACYQPEQSSPRDQFYYFSYDVTITNLGEESVQLLSRHWLIKTSKGEAEEVIGEGVVGQQPVIPPQHQFRYTSACPLSGSRGKMEGSYQMLSESGKLFDAIIPCFELSRPSHLRLVKS